MSVAVTGLAIICPFSVNLLPPERTATLPELYAVKRSLAISCEPGLSEVGEGVGEGGGGRKLVSVGVGVGV